MGKKRKLKPVFKAVLVSTMFVFGVIIISKVFTVFDVMASENKVSESKILHGVITLKANGESHLRILESDYKGRIKVDSKIGYGYFEIVSAVVEDDKVINHYITSGEELSLIEDKFKSDISIIRLNIADSISE